MKGELEKRILALKGAVLDSDIQKIVDEARKDWLENVAFGDKPNEFVDDTLAKEWFETWFLK